jgi:uncharacterized protein YjbI with pentapeptide repeats
VLKRWTALPQGIRWLVGIVAVIVLALPILWALFILVPDWIAHHDVGSSRGVQFQTARDAARGRLLTLFAGLFAAVAVVYTARNFTLSRRTFELTEQGQVTDRYTKAIEQLGSDKLDVRIGGIYALERIARDSERDHPTVIEVLTAFIREHSNEPWPPAQPGGAKSKPVTRPDIQAAVTVLGRRDRTRDIRPIDLTAANLSGVNLGGVYSRAVFYVEAVVGADLRAAILYKANLTGANLAQADLVGANLTGAVLAEADLTGAILDRSILSSARFTGATLKSVRFARAILSDADFSGADLSHVNLSGRDLSDVNLSNANLDSAQLDGARWRRDSPVPPGWELEPDTDLLKRTGTAAKATEAN